MSKNVATLPLARCAAVIQPPPLRSSCKRGFSPPFDPPPRSFAPWTQPRLCASGHRTNPARIGCASGPFRPETLTRGFAPWTRAGGLHPRHPGPKGKALWTRSGIRPDARAYRHARSPRPNARPARHTAPASHRLPFCIQLAPHAPTPGAARPQAGRP
jgi:hypothetical protein